MDLIWELEILTKMGNKEESLKKLKFYDTWFYVLSISLVLFFLGIFLLDYESDIILLIWIIPTFVLLISLGIITWGMIYHEAKRKEWVWIIFTILAFLLGIGGFVVSIIFYFVKMRKAFKKGEGIYDEEVSEKEKKQIEHYKKHKEEIDKKGNEEFFRFLNGIGILIGIIILALMIKSIFF